MKITSSAFRDGEKIPLKYTADGENINPPLTISEIPSGTKSLVLICDDPDAKKVVGYTWIHWVVFNISPEEEVKIREDSIPGTSGESTYGKEEYGGPSPPKGTGIHNYHFKFYALDKKLDLSKMAKLEMIKKEMKNHILDSSELIGQYCRE